MASTGKMHVMKTLRTPLATDKCPTRQTRSLRIGQLGIHGHSLQQSDCKLACTSLVVSLQAEKIPVCLVTAHSRDVILLVHTGNASDGRFKNTRVSNSQLLLTELWVQIFHLLSLSFGNVNLYYFSLCVRICLTILINIFSLPNLVLGT